MSDKKEKIDVTQLKPEELGKIKSEVLQRLLKGQTLPRTVESNLTVSHDRHSSVHSKG